MYLIRSFSHKERNCLVIIMKCRENMSTCLIYSLGNLAMSSIKRRFPDLEPMRTNEKKKQKNEIQQHEMKTTSISPHVSKFTSFTIFMSLALHLKLPAAYKAFFRATDKRNRVRVRAIERVRLRSENRKKYRTTEFLHEMVFV